jgi:hypothetical protein
MGMLGGKNGQALMRGAMAKKGMIMMMIGKLCGGNKKRR